MNEDLRIVTYTDAARMLGVGFGVIKNMVDSGQLRSVGLGKKQGIPLIELKRYVLGEEAK